MNSQQQQPQHDHQQQQIINQSETEHKTESELMMESEFNSNENNNQNNNNHSPSNSNNKNSSYPLESPVYQRRYSNKNSHPSSSQFSQFSKVATSVATEFHQPHSTYHRPRPASPVNLTSALKLVKTFNGDADKFIKWRHEIKMAFKHLGWYYQLENNYFEPLQNKDRFSSIYIPSGESTAARLHREANEEENKLKLKTKLSLLSAQEQLDIDSGYALIWGTLGESLSDLLLPPNSQEGNPYDLYTNICLKFQSLTLLDKNRLQLQLDELKLGPSEDTDKFFARVSQLCTQLSTAGVPISVEQIKYKIYKALPMEYKSIIKTYQISYPNLSIDELKIHLREEQAEMRDSKRSNAGTGSAHAFTHDSNKNNNNNNKNNNNNDKKKKKQKHKSGGNPPDASKATCFRCGATGHFVQECKHDKSRMNCSFPGCKHASGSHNFAAHKAAEKYNAAKAATSSTSGFSGVLMEVVTSVATESHSISSDPVSLSSTSTTSSSHTTKDLQSITLVLDSGCTGHVVKYLEWLSNIRDVEPLQFITASGQVCISNKSGTLTVRLDTGTLLTLFDVRCAPGLVVNLISVDQLELRGITTLFKPKSGYALLTNPNGQVLQVPRIGKLRLLHGSPIIPVSSIQEGAFSVTVLPTISEVDLENKSVATETKSVVTESKFKNKSVATEVATFASTPSRDYFTVKQWGAMSESNRIEQLKVINIKDAVRVQVRDSKQKGGGKGLFALQLFTGPKAGEKSGAYILPYIGTVLNEKQASKLKPNQKGYVARYSNHTYIDACNEKLSNVARFANRGTLLSSSNARLVAWGGALWIHPLTTINVGDEILLCYNRFHDIDGTATSNINPVEAYPIENAGLSVTTDGALLSEYDLWHYRLGHLAKTGLESVIKSQCVHGMNIKDIKSAVSLSHCPSCQIAKAKRLSYANIKIDHISSIMDQWDMDLCGPIHSSAGTHYMLIIIDVHSRYTFIKIINSKDEAEQEIINLIILEQNQTGRKLRKLHSDGGGELTSNVLNTFCTEQGILRTTTTRNTAEHNAKVERANGTITSNTRASLLYAGVPDGFWRYAAINTVYVRNRVTTKGINVGKSITQQVTPFQVWFSRRPDIKHLRVLFCDCYCINETKLPGKLQPPGIPAIYVGYNEIKSGYNCYDITTDKVITTRHVTFIENSFTHSAKLKLNVDSSAYDYTNQSEQDLFSSQLDQNELELVKQISLQEYKSNSSSSSSNDYSSTIKNGAISGSVDNTKENHINTKVATSVEVATKSSPKSNRNHKVVTSVATESEKENKVTTSVATDSSPNTKTKTKVKFDTVNENNIITSGSSRRRNTVWRLGMVDYEKDVSAHSFFSNEDEIAFQSFALSAHVSVSDLPDPRNYKEAMSLPDAGNWSLAMQKEINSLTDNGTWNLVALPSGSHVMGCRWVYKKKIDADGKITYKARLCAQGFSQKEDEYGETYAPVLGYTSLRILLSIATKLDYDLNQMDVCTAFLNADVKETIYMKQPEGFTTPDGKVCKLVKTLYGLKQSPYEWNKLLNSFFIDHSWVRCVSDPCVYWKMSKTNQVMFTGVFVDDSLSGYSPTDRPEFNAFKTLFMKRFKSVDLGEVKQILGMIVVRDRVKGTLFLHQKPYTLKLLKTFKMLNCKSASTPEALSLVKLLPKERIPIKTDSDYEEHRNKMNEFPHSQYLAIVGSVIYLMISTRPDIAHAVHVLSKYMSNYTDLHLKCAKHLLRYLAGTADYGLLFKSNGGIINAGGTSHITYVPRPKKPEFGGKVKVTTSVATEFQSSKINGMDKHIVDLYDVKHAINRSDGSIEQTSQILYSASEQAHTASSITTFGMSDANYGGDRESLHGNIKRDYKSVTASLVYIGKFKKTKDEDDEKDNADLVAWKSTTQSRIAQSSCESEYMAAVKTANKIVWINSLLGELSFIQLSPSILYVDNQAAIALSKNTYTGDQSRHIAIPFHVIKEYNEHLQIDTQWIDTKSQNADILTKCLSKDLFIPLRDKLVSKLL